MKPALNPDHRSGQWAVKWYAGTNENEYRLSCLHGSHCLILSVRYQPNIRWQHLSVIFPQRYGADRPSNRAEFMTLAQTYIDNEY